MTSRKLHIGMSLAPTWLSGDAWRRGDSRAEDLFNIDYFVEIARRSESAKLDFLFRPDTLFLQTAALEGGNGFAALDPTILLAAIARDTQKIGLLSTVSTTFYPPYVVARQLQSLNVISRGRAGWNIVTALDGNENFGLDEMPSPEDRYGRAAEFTKVVRKLWESFPGEALLVDKASGRYADTSKIQPIDHAGDHFSVKGPLNVPSAAPSRIPLIQAGASPTGRDFAASVADAIFAATPDKEAAAALRSDLRQRASCHGRSPDSIKMLPGLSLYLADTQAEADDLFAATHQRMDTARKLGSIKEMIGLDLTHWEMDKPIMAKDLPAPPQNVRSRTHANLLHRMIVRDAPTPSELLKRPEVIGSAHWQIIGTVEEAVDQIRDWRACDAMDGFIAVPGGSATSLSLTLEALVPALAAEGLFRLDYSGETFLDHLNE
ncbi:NtaA/DmoA family FMN-dependent monooxygenase [Roseibium sp.]|uniref:NtaA/DmoA family FMN-dependent monooxygenase n=1 Tax=Roseibium sp. TaxID=1936156 RepID=UPI003A9885D7